LIIKVDSGLGQTNIDMLTYMHGLGVYCYSGIPNTTHVSQETDQNYDLFKSNFRLNLEILSQARFDIQKTLLISEQSLLVLGGKNEGCTDAVVQDYFSRAFSVEGNLRCYGKYGAVSLTFSVFQSDQMHHEVVYDVDGIIDVDTNPKANLLYKLEMENKM